MSARTKLPYNPNPPIYGEPPQLDLPEGIFDGIKHDKYSSKYFDDRETLDYFRGVYQEVREDGKGRVLFPDEEQFLSALDDALLHFDMCRSIVTHEDPDYLKNQRSFFKRLSIATNDLSDLLSEAGDDHVLRLAHAGYRLSAAHDPDSHESALPQLLEQLNQSTEAVRSELKNKKVGRFAELYLLIEQLVELPEQCSGHQCSVSYSDLSETYSGSLHRLVSAVIPLLNLENTAEINDSTIASGIKLIKKQ